MYRNGKFYPEGLDAVRSLLRSLAKQGGLFLKSQYNLHDNEKERLRVLISMDSIIFRSWESIHAKLGPFSGSGGGGMFPYWGMIKDFLVDANKNNRTLYSCITFK